MDRLGIPGIPQRLPAPLDLSKALSSKLGSFSKNSSRSRSRSRSMFKPKPLPVDFFRTFTSKLSPKPIPKLSPKKKCPKGTRKNRQTKVCETESVIGFRTKRRYTKGANKKCPKGTRRNKVTNNCDPK